MSDREGKRPALKFTAGGPICRQCPLGRYQLEASYHDAKRSVATTVAQDAKQPAGGVPLPRDELAERLARDAVEERLDLLERSLGRRAVGAPGTPVGHVHRAGLL